MSAQYCETLKIVGITVLPPEPVPCPPPQPECPAPVNNPNACGPCNPKTHIVSTGVLPTAGGLLIAELNYDLTSPSVDRPPYNKCHMTKLDVDVNILLADPAQNSLVTEVVVEILKRVAPGIYQSLAVSPVFVLPADSLSTLVSYSTSSLSTPIILDDRQNIRVDVRYATPFVPQTASYPPTIVNNYSISFDRET